MKKRFKKLLKVILITFIFVLFVQIFVIQSFIVMSSRMKSSLFEGDFLMVEKLSYGARMPITILSIPFLHKEIPFTNKKAFLDILNLSYFRFPGISKIKKNDLIVFNLPKEDDLPIDKKSNFIKRCIAVSGDTLEIKNKNVIINGEKKDNILDVEFKCRVTTDGDKNFFKLLKNKYYLKNINLVAENMGIYDVFLSKKNMKKLKKEKSVKYVRVLKQMINKPNFEEIFPKNHFYRWNKDYFGKIIVPKKNQNVKLNLRTLALYKRIIKVYENKNLKIKNDSIFINNKFSDNYTFEKNYYFVMDDSRDRANDSRYWGFLPEDHIIGKANFIWFSYDNFNGKIRWERILKKI